MQQTLHIFKKDMRFLWREISFLLMLAMVFAWIGGGVVSDAFEPLFVAAAGFTIVRLIHAEAIPGQSQFWITRPYRWQSLLAAKLLFILVFMTLPLLLAQATVLINHRFPASAFFSGLLWSQVLILVCVLLPLVVLASMTQSMIEFVGSPLATVFLAFIIVYFLHDLTWNLSMTPTGVGWLRDAVLFVALAVIIPLVLYLQYKSRRTQLSRYLSVGIAICATVIYLTVRWQTLFAMQSHLSKLSTSNLEVARDPARKFGLWRGDPGELRWTNVRSGERAFHLSLPFFISGMPEGTNARFEGFGVSLQTPDGRILHPGDQRLRIDQSALSGDFWLNPQLLDEKSGRPLTLRATLYITLFGHSREKTISLSKTPQNVLDGVQCFDAAFNQLECRSPFRWPGLLISQKNPGGGRNPLTGLISYSPFPADLQLDPIVGKSPVYYAAETPAADRLVTIEAEEPLAYLSRDLEVPDLYLNKK